MADNMNSAKAELLKIKLKDLYMDWRNTRSTAGLGGALKGAPETVAAPETTKAPETLTAPEPTTMDADIMPSTAFEAALKSCEDEYAKLDKAETITQQQYDAFNALVDELMKTEDYKGLDEKVPAEKAMKDRVKALQTSRILLKNKVGLVIAEKGVTKKTFTVSFKVYTNLSYKYRNMDEYINCLNNGDDKVDLKERMKKKAEEWAIEEQMSLAEIALTFEVSKHTKGDSNTYTVGTPLWGKPRMHPEAIVLLEPGQAFVDNIALTIKRTPQKAFAVDAEKLVQGTIGLVSYAAKEGNDDETITTSPVDSHGNENVFFKDVVTKDKTVTETTENGGAVSREDKDTIKTTPSYTQKKHAGTEFADDLEGYGKNSMTIAQSFKSTTKAEEKAFVMLRIEMSNGKPKLAYRAKEFGMLDKLAYRKWEGINLKKQRFMLVSNIEKVAAELASF